MALKSTIQHFTYPLLHTMLCAVVLCLVPSRATVAQIYSPETFVLENGLRGIVVTNDRSPVVTHMIWYQVGRRDEPYGQSGLAHFLEHLMFKGTPNVPNGEFSKIITSLGGKDNAFTSQDYTAYYQSVAKEYLPRVVAMEADRMRNLELSSDVIETERGVIMAERAQRLENDPYGAFWEDVSQSLYMNHPYATPVIGWPHEILALRHDNIIDFYNRWYHPNNAVVIFSGDITTGEAIALSRRFYGPIPGGNIPERTQHTLTLSKSHKTITKTSPQIQQRSWTRSFIAPSATPETIRVTDALNLGRIILGGGSTSRFYQELVVKQKLATGVTINYDMEGLGPKTLTIFVSVADGASMEKLEESVNTLLDEFVKNGPTEQELKDARQRLQISVVYARDSLQGPAMDIGKAVSSGLNVETIENWTQRLQAVTIDDIKTISDAVYNPLKYGGNAYLTGILLPESGAQ